MSVHSVAREEARPSLAIPWRRWPNRPRWRVAPLILAALPLVGFIMLVPAYLLLRTAGAGPDALALLVRPSVLAAAGRTVLLAAAVTLSATLLAVPLAWLTSCTDLPGRRLWTVLTTLPLVLPSYVVAYLLASVLGPRGWLQQSLSPLGVTRLPAIYGFPGALLALTLMTYPFVLLTTRAALRRADPALLEAARTLGLSSGRAFWRVTVPQLRPAIVAGALLVALYVLRDFGAVTTMRYTTFTRLIYMQYQSFADRSLAAGLSLVLVAMTAAVLFLEVRSRSRAAYAGARGCTPRPPRLVRLGLWRWPALLFCSLVVALALLLPAGSLLAWLLRGAGALHAIGDLGIASFNSLSASLAAAAITILAALPLAILAVRRPGRLSRLLEGGAYAGFALPGIVVALALTFFGARYARSLYQTLPLLIAGYVLLFAPQAVGALRASLLQIPGNLEEAGRSLGHRPAKVFGRVTYPLLRPGVAAALVLVFLTTMKELPATLLLSPPGYTALSAAVWSNISEAFFARAAAPALALILLSSLPLALLSLREHP